MREKIYQPTWESLDRRDTPCWFKDAKFGIFIHWGVYSVPSWAPKGKYAEWYWYDMVASGETKKFHHRVYGKDFKYQYFAPLFRAELFDPEKWAELFALSGAKYVVLVSKHHDGFCLWKAPYSWNWNSVDVGPCRDLVKDITCAVRKKGLKMGLYYSLYEWFNPLYQKNINAYVEKYMLVQMKDLVVKYRPSIIFADGEWEHSSKVWRSEEFLAYLFNESPVKDEVVVNDRWGKETRTLHGGYWTSEYGKYLGEGREITPHHIWEECQGIGSSFGYNRCEEISDYKTAEDLIYLLVNTVSKGGNLLLNVGPDADGKIPDIMQERLLEIGKWLKVCGEAIYGTRYYMDSKETSIRYTCKDNTVYIISFGIPKKELVFNLKPASYTDVKMLGYKGKLKWKFTKNKMYIDLSSVCMKDISVKYAYVFKVSF